MRLPALWDKLFTGFRRVPDTEAEIVNALCKAARKKPFRFYIDIVDACNLRCVICPRGVHHRDNTSRRMDLSVFNRLLDKITSECRCPEINLFNWTEPFLHPELDKFVQAVRKRRIRCGLSTNLSFNKPALLERVLCEGPGMAVSVSGFEQGKYEMYHRGGNVERVKENLRFIADVRKKRKVRPHVEVHCLQFTDNQDDQLLWAQFCKEFGFVYRAKPAESSEVATPAAAARLLRKPAFDEMPDGTFRPQRNLSDSPVFKPCRLHNTIPIDCECEAFLCCIYSNRKDTMTGNYLALPLDDIQLRRLAHRECAYCNVRIA